MDVDVDVATEVHRVLASPVRMQLLTLLRAGGASDVTELAAQLELHANTVRSHLSQLEDVGLVATAPEERDTPGRPRHVYRATSTADEAAGGGSYRFLAEVLAGYLGATATDPAAAAEEAGQAWGRHLVEAPEPFRRVTPEEAVHRLVALLGDLGFAPEHDTTSDDAPRILLHRCPFLDVARDHEEVVCSVHLGLMRGALDELGVTVEARGLQPFVAPSLCVADLALPTS